MKIGRTGHVNKTPEREKIDKAHQILQVILVTIRKGIVIFFFLLER
jgi:hypothetical protein